MATTYSLIASNTLSSSAASVTFSAIPNTFTDLVVRVSARSSTAGSNAEIIFTLNGSTASNYSNTKVYGLGSSGTGSNRESSAARIEMFVTDAAGSTSNTFSSHEIYIPNYTASANKPMSVFSAQENNQTEAYIAAVAGLWRDTSAVTSITIDTTADFVSGSSFLLYGIKNS